MSAALHIRSPRHIETVFSSAAATDLSPDSPVCRGQVTGFCEYPQNTLCCQQPPGFVHTPIATDFDPDAVRHVPASAGDLADALLCYGLAIPLWLAAAGSLLGVVIRFSLKETVHMKQAEQTVTVHANT